MTILDDLFGSINPFSSKDERNEHQHNVEQRATNLLHSAQESAAEVALDTIKFIGRHTGFDLSYEMANHYQAGNGKVLDLSEDKLEKFKTIQQAEDKNQQRLIGSITKNGVLYKKEKNGKMRPVKFDQIKDHDRVYLKDYYDVDENEKIEASNHDKDLEFSLGSLNYGQKAILNLPSRETNFYPTGMLNIPSKILTILIKARISEPWQIHWKKHIKPNPMK